MSVGILTRAELLDAVAKLAALFVQSGSTLTVEETSKVLQEFGDACYAAGTVEGANEARRILTGGPRNG